jgi:5-methylcytosine-specific restriction endonuclease McrA
MVGRAPKACSIVGCPNTSEHGTYRCAEHRVQPWAGSQRSASTGTAAWKRLRAAVLARDNYRCQLRLPGCIVSANECDHIRPFHEFADPKQADTMDNCRAVCHVCHAKRSGQQGGRAEAGSPRDGSGGPVARPRRTKPKAPGWSPSPPIRYGRRS